MYALNLAIGLSLGLAIDYSLLITRATGRRWPAERTGHAGPSRAPCRPPARACCSGDHRRRRAGGADGVPAALPLLDGPRRSAGGADRGRRGPAGPAGRPGAARHARSTRWPRSPGSAAARRTTRRSPPGSGTACRNAVMRRPALIATLTTVGLLIVAMPFLNIYVHLGRRGRPADERDRPPGVGRDRVRLPARTAASRSTSRSTAPDTPEAQAKLAAYARGSGAARRRPPSPRPSVRRRGLLADRRLLGRPAALRREPDPGRRHPRDAGAVPDPRRRAHRRASWTRRTASRRTCRGRSW